MWHPGQRPLLWGPTAQTQRPLAHFPLSLFSLPLILLWSLSSLACPLLYMACSPAAAPSMPPQLWNTVSPHSITSLACAPGRQLHQIERVSPVGGGECFPALGAAKHSVAYSLCYNHPRENRSLLWGGSEAKLHVFYKANWPFITHSTCFENLAETNIKHFHVLLLEDTIIAILHCINPCIDRSFI